LWQQPRLLAEPGVPRRALLWLYLAFALPMLLSLPGAVEVGKSLRTTVGSLRFGALAAGMLGLYVLARDRTGWQQAVLAGLGLVTALVVGAWCLDALLQASTGRNVLGYGLGEGYVNGVFGEDDNIKLGMTVALLMPLAAVHALRSWPMAAALALLCLMLAAVVLSGKRSAWVIAIVELLALAAYCFVRGHLGMRRVLLVGTSTAIVLGAAFLGSDWVHDRSVVLVEAVENPDYEALNRASGRRLPIWSTALRMGADNWLNGVGARGLRYAYDDYAASGDEWAQPLADGRPGTRASHAHQLLLDLFSESGIFGLLGYLAIVAVLLRLWHDGSAAARSRALPFGLALCGMLFPINTHPAWYSSWSSSLLWLFIGLYLLALCDEPAPAEQSP
jgi:O-antigen ligase